MSSLSDIPSRLIYTRLSGWIDVGHAGYRQNGMDSGGNPVYAFRPECAQARLWRDINGGTAFRSAIGPGYKVSFSMAAGRSALVREVSRAQIVRYVALGLDRDRKLAIAIDMLRTVTTEFEDLQDTAGFYSLGLITDSGYSVEDLVSNMVGLYSASHDADLLNRLQPLSVDASRCIFNTIGGVEKHKNRTYFPYLFDAGTGQLARSRADVAAIASRITGTDLRPLVTLSGSDYRVWQAADESRTCAERRFDAPAH